MLVLPQKGIRRVQHNLGSVGTANVGTSVTTGASSATKGTPAEIFSATLFDAYKMRLVIGGGSLAVSNTNSACCVDILIGAATAEVLIPNLLVGMAGPFNGANVGPRYFEFPIYIPAGSRIAAQAASLRTSQAVRVGVILIGGDGNPSHRVAGRVVTYGIGTVPNGTSITQGASGAEGAWAAITASTTERHWGLVPSYQCSATAAQNAAMAVDIGMGGAGAEVQISEGHIWHSDAAERMSGPFHTEPVIMDIPAGTRLVMRCSSSGTAVAGDGALHALV